LPTGKDLFDQTTSQHDIKRQVIFIVLF